jgi:deoxycytidylate deaminase
MVEEFQDSPWPQETELVIGLVGPIGIDLGEVYNRLAQVLTQFEYQCHDLHLSDQLREIAWTEQLTEEPADERIWSYMSAGNRLRELWGRDDAFAILAINAITLARQEAGAEADKPLARHAYVLRSLKRREEAALLRDVYGSRFVLLSIYAPKQDRAENLRERIRQSRVHPHPVTPVYTAEALIERDQHESTLHGQEVRGLFHEGDFFIDVRRDLAAETQRTMELLFGHPHRTPRRDEVGMFHAVAAGRQSAELGRQVGAAICTNDGSLVAVGTNEVPRPGGGHYWEGDSGDAREFTKGQDTSDAHKTTMARDLVDKLTSDGLIADGVSEQQLLKSVNDSSIDDLIEFVRAVHAEMSAITDAARRGISVQDTVLFVTTFPCHHCARHIVAAGINRVVYIAPYPKSLAEELHGDAIVVDPGDLPESDQRITFEPFVGVGPSRYLDVFQAPQRKDRASGDLLPFIPAEAIPRVRDLVAPEMLGERPAYMEREERVFEILMRITTEDGAPGFRE